MPTLGQALQRARAAPVARLYVGSVTVVAATTITVSTPDITLVARRVATGVTPVVGNTALVLEQQGVGRFGFVLT